MLLSPERAPLLSKLGQAFRLQVSVRQRNMSVPAVKVETVQSRGPGVSAAAPQGEL